MLTCAACGQENPDGTRFCPACGAALVASERRREERKVVTVLFADLVGFTSRAEQLDPEDVRAVLAPYWERLRSELERFGGTVEKFIGDAVMALFGAPVSREDDPERAVRAALAIRDWAREEEGLQVRIAVTTGEALVLLGARPGEGEGMAAGDVVNTAARLQSAAPVNGVLVGETTYRATRDVIEYLEREPVEAKGKADPVPVWEAVDARSRLGMDLEQRTVVRLVGRVRELDALVGAFDRARGDREPQLVTLVGAPGIGKSRLVAELFARLDASPDIVWWRQGRALPYGDGVSFWALGEMVKAQAGVQENDPLEIAREKIWASVESAVAEDDRAWIAQHLLPLVGGEQLDAAGPREESFSAWRRYFEGLADQRPLVLVFEDLHWADDGLLDFIDQLADWSSGVPLLVVGTARPELLDRRPGWGGGKLNSTTLALTPLADAEAAQIIGEVLQQALLPADTQQALLERAGGNPLYAEQFARLYAERGSTEDLPETIQGIIAARLDGLGADEKRLIQDAAVLGKVFWAGAAAELAELDPARLEPALHSLERKGLLRRERRSAVGGEDEYAFRHVLVRDVAYGQIPRAARVDKHIAAAAWLERLGRADDHAELVAHHYHAALELGIAIGGIADYVADRARIAFRSAGDRALRLSAFPAAERFYVDALASWPDDAERPHVLFAHARARFHAVGDPAQLLEARDALEAAGEVEAAAEAGVIAAHAAWRSGRSADAEELLGRARSLLVGRPPSRALAEALAESARLAAFGGRLTEAEETSMRALELAKEFELDELEANVLNTLGVVSMVSGALRQSRDHTLEVVTGPTRSTEYVRALINLAVLHDSDGFPIEGARFGALAREAATRTGDRPMLLWIESGAIQAELYTPGRWDEALARATTFLDTVVPLGGHYVVPSIRLVRAKINAARGEVDAALQDVDAALAQLGPNADPQNTLPTLLVAAHVHLTLGNHDEAMELMEKSFVPAMRASGSRAPSPGGDSATTFVRTGHAEDWLDLCRTRFAETGRVWAAKLVCEGQTVDAAELYAYIAGREDEAVVRLLAAEQLVEAGRRAEADDQLQQALVFYRSVGATAVIKRAEALLAAAS
jgi:class 3 adenylate cyclase